MSRPIDPSLRMLCSICGKVYLPRKRARELGTIYCSKSCSNRSRKTTLSERFQRRFKPLADKDACWPWAGSLDKEGYGIITDETRRQLRAHRLAYEFANGPIQAGRHIMHTCDNPPCCNPSHLRAGTADDNNQDKAKKLRASAKLTPDDVRQIRQLLRAGHSVLAIAQRFGVTYGAIYPIAEGRTWKHVE